MNSLCREPRSYQRFLPLEPGVGQSIYSQAWFTCCQESGHSNFCLSSSFIFIYSVSPLSALSEVCHKERGFCLQVALMTVGVERLCGTNTTDLLVWGVCASTKRRMAACCHANTWESASLATTPETVLCLCMTTLNQPGRRCLYWPPELMSSVVAAVNYEVYIAPCQLRGVYFPQEVMWSVLPAVNRVVVVARGMLCDV